MLITTLVVSFLVCCMLDVRCGLAGVVSGLQVVVLYPGVVSGLQVVVLYPGVVSGLQAIVL